jgi:hypothetical protein
MQSVEAERNKYLLTFDNSFKGLFLNFNAFNEMLQKGPIKQTTNNYVLRLNDLFYSILFIPCHILSIMMFKCTLMKEQINFFKIKIKSKSKARQCPYVTKIKYLEILQSSYLEQDYSSYGKYWNAILCSMHKCISWPL